MPSYRNKYNKKPRRKTYAQYKKKKQNKALAFNRAKPRIARGYQVLNKYRAKSHYFEDTYSTQTTGTPPIVNWAALPTFVISNLDRYSQLKLNYRQYRVKFFKIRMVMLQIENSDGATIPELFIRYNYDVDMPLPTSEATMRRQQNMVYKRFLQGDGSGTDFTYTVKPATMLAQRISGSNNYVHAPKFNQWCDFQNLATDEPVHYGMQMLIPNIPTGVNFEFQFTVGYECRDVI
jgi:hypothetical protein